MSLWQKDQPSLNLKESPQDPPALHQHWKVSGHCQVEWLESLWPSHNWSHGKSVKLRLRHFQTEYSTRWILCFELSHKIDEIFLKMLLACLKSYWPNHKNSLVVVIYEHSLVFQKEITLREKQLDLRNPLENCVIKAISLNEVHQRLLMATSMMLQRAFAFRS